MISYKKSLAILNRNKIFIDDEKINTKDSINRVNSKNLFSKVNYPAAKNSAFDGFAIKSSDSNAASKKNVLKFKILKVVSAGQKPSVKYKKNTCIEIMTGAVIPRNFDTIIPVEKAKIIKFKNRRYLCVNRKEKKYQYLRFAGSDYKKNELIIAKGKIINSSHVLALKTLGYKKILVKKKPKILFFSTGNEISDKDNIDDWMVRNSNSYYLRSLRSNFLFNYFDGGTLKDNSEKKFYNILKNKFKSKFDIIITSGAVSAGKFDFIPSVIKKFKTKAYFKGVLMRPGKPILFCKFKSKNKSFFGLPGNPISSAACFRFFVYPYLLKILSVEREKPIYAILKNKFIKKRNFTRFLKAKLTNKKSKLEVEILKAQESFRIKSFINSNVWAVMDDKKSHFKKGEIIKCFNSQISNKFLL